MDFNKPLVFSAAMALLALCGCSASPPTASLSPSPAISPTPVASPSQKSPVGWQISSFGIQLQNLDLSQAKASPFDMLICDYSHDGSAARRYSKEEVDQLKSGGRKLVGYLSVGEAESYRGYWKKSWKPGSPVWLGPTNPEWGGNYKVHFWDPQWHSLVFAYADSIIEQGFDGLFLDVVDGYEFWESKRPSAAADMRQLVIELSKHVRAKYGSEVGIFLNGGAGLVGDPKVLDAITGVAKEEIFFGLGGDSRPSAPETTRLAQQQLQPVVQSGRLVLSIDYTSKSDQAKLAHQKAKEAGYLEYVGVRNLDRLILDANPSPK